ncbi:MAG TPA: hypothetical protein VNN80_05260, partial [Polyangiaceae bacterium]|nr:hypothetical protein [Polyangiaceae bacterium]
DTIRGALGIVALCGCTRDSAQVHEEPTPPSTSATYNLAPASLGRAARHVADAGAARAAPSEPVPSPPAVPGRPATAGAPSPTCVKGWVAPERGSSLRSAVLNMLRSRPGERFVVEEMRYFVGPEDADVVDPRGNVERWYVKAYSELEPRRRQRWLVRRAAIGSGVDAVAPYESKGYGPSIWRRPDTPDEGLADPFAHPCRDARPGERCMGLPREVLGCLAGT